MFLEGMEKCFIISNSKGESLKRKSDTPAELLTKSKRHHGSQQ